MTDSSRPPSPSIDPRDYPALSVLLRSHFDRGADAAEMRDEARRLADVSDGDPNKALVAEAIALRRATGNDKGKLFSLLAELVRLIRGDEPDWTTNNGGSYARKSMPDACDCPGLAGHVRLMLSTDNYWSPESVEGQLLHWMKNPPAEYRDELERLAGVDEADTRRRVILFVGTTHGAPTDPAQTRTTKLTPIPPFVPFPTDTLPEPIAGAITAHAAAIGCDPCMVALPMLAALASSIGNARRIRLKTSWSEPSIVWSVIVAPSGFVKSPPFDAALVPLRATQDLALKNYLNDQATHQTELLRYEAALRDWKNSKKGRASEPPTPPKEPRAERNIVVDATVEAIAPILRDNPRGLLLARDELSGWLRGFDQYKQGRGSDVSHWLEWFRGAPSTIDRKTGSERIIHIPRASVSLCGTVQPEALRRSLGTEHFADGLAARLLLAMPPQTQRVWSEAVVAPEIETSVAMIFGRLLALQPTDGQPVLVDLSPAAKSAWIAWFNRHGREQAALTGDLAAAWSKLEGYAARFALVIYLTRIAAGDREAGEGDEIAEQDVAAAIRLVDWFANEATRVYAILSQTPEEAECREVVDLIQRQGGSITARDLRRASRRFRTTEAADAILAELVRSNLADWYDVHPGKQGGRPTRTCRLRPRSDPVDADETPDDSSTPNRESGPAS